MANAFNFSGPVISSASGVSSGQNFIEQRRQAAADSRMNAFRQTLAESVDETGNLRPETAFSLARERGLMPEMVQFAQSQVDTAVKRAQAVNAMRPKLGEAKPGQMGGKDIFFRTDDHGNAYDLAGNKITNVTPRPMASAAPKGYRINDNGELEPIPGGPKSQLPAPALKLQQEELDAIGTAGNIKNDLGGIRAQLEANEIDLGPISNVGAQVRNFIGRSNEQSRNFATFKATLERLRNDSLRLNKGVQTEGDAQRAWNELFASINDQELVKQRLQEIEQINERAATLRKMNVDVIRSNYSLPSLDTSGYTNQPSPFIPKSPKQEQPTTTAPNPAVEYLKRNNSPAVRQQFKSKYGYLPEGF